MRLLRTVLAALALRQSQMRREARWQTASTQLVALNPKAVLARGYALVRDDAGAPVRSADQIQPGARLTIEFGDDTRLDAMAVSDSAATPAVKKPRKTKPKAPAAPKDQGSLF